MVDYRFWFHPCVELGVSQVTERYNSEHGDSPANAIWVCSKDYESLTKNGMLEGLGIGNVFADPCIRVSGNIMIGRLEV